MAGALPSGAPVGPVHPGLPNKLPPTEITKVGEPPDLMPETKVMPDVPVPAMPPEASDGPANRRIMAGSPNIPAMPAQSAAASIGMAGGGAGAVAGSPGMVGGVGAPSAMGEVPDYGADAAFLAKVQRTHDFTQKLGKFNALPPDQKAQMMQQAGVNPQDMQDFIGSQSDELKQQQQTEQQASAQQGAKGQEIQKLFIDTGYAQKLDDIGKALELTGMIGLGPAAWGMYGIAAGTTVTSAMITAEIAKSALIYQMSQYGGEAGIKINHKINPNAGPGSDFAANMIGGAIVGGVTGAAIEPRIPEAVTNLVNKSGDGGSGSGGTGDFNPEAGAAVKDTHSTYTEPVGMKSVDSQAKQVDPYSGIDLSDHLVTQDSLAREQAKRELKIAAEEPQFKMGIPQAPEAAGPSVRQGEAPPTQAPSVFKGMPPRINGKFIKWSQAEGQGIMPTAKPGQEPVPPVQPSPEEADLPKYAAAKEEQRLATAPTAEYYSSKFKSFIDKQGLTNPKADTDGIANKITDKLETGKLTPQNLTEAFNRFNGAGETSAADFGKELDKVAPEPTKPAPPVSEEQVGKIQAKGAAEVEQPPTTEGKLAQAWDKFMKYAKGMEKGSVGGRQLTEKEMDALREHFGDWAIPAVQGAMNAADDATLDKYRNLMPEQNKGMFQQGEEGQPAPTEPTKPVVLKPEQLVSARARAASLREKPPAPAAPVDLTETAQGEKVAKAKFVSPQQQAAKVTAKEGTAEEPEAGPTIDKKAAMAAAHNNLIRRQGAMAERLDLHENEPAANAAVLAARKGGGQLGEDEMDRFQQAKDQSIENIQKIAAEHLDASSHDDNLRVATAADLYQHEVAKLGHLQRAMGESTADVAQDVAKAAIDSPDLLNTIGSFKGTKAAKFGKTAMTMGWRKYLDPANIAVTASLWNPKLFLGKAILDTTWIPYQNILKGAGRLMSAHPTDAVRMWAASCKGAVEAPLDAIKYAGESLKYGSHAAEDNLGMMRGDTDRSITGYDDYSDTNPGKAIQQLASQYSEGPVGQVKRIAGMTLNAGPRVLLAQDQMAKTFAYRMAVRTAALSKALDEADAAGYIGHDRWQYANMRAESYVNDMPDWLVKQASDEAYRFTFTNYNKTAQWVQQGMNAVTIPSWGPLPEMHIGRLFGGLYITTPFNMMKEGFVNTPMGYMMPETSGAYEGGSLRANITSAGMAVQTAKAATAAAMMVAIYEHAGGMRITGNGDCLTPDQHKLRQDMRIPDNSIGFGNHYYSYDMMGPMKIILGFAANMAEAHGAASAANKGEYWKQALTAFASTIDHGPMMHQMPFMFQALSAAAQGNYKELGNYIEEAATMPIRPVIAKNIADTLDPRMTDAKSGIWNLIKQSWPGYKAGVPLQRDHWGNPQFVPPGYERDEVPPNPLTAFLYQTNPFHRQVMPKIDPVDQELFRISADLKAPDENMFIGGQGPQGLQTDPNSSKVGVFYHPTDPVEAARLRDRYWELEGHETLINGLNQHDYMEKVMNSDFYQKHDDAWQKSKMEYYHSMFMKQAAIQLEREESGPGGLADRVKQRKADQRMERNTPSPDSPWTGGGGSIGAP